MAPNKEHLKKKKKKYAGLGNPITYRDPTGMFSVTALAVTTSIISLLASLLLGPGDLVQSVTESLISTYAANQEWDVDWAARWGVPDDLHSRLDNRWVIVAVGMGLYNAFDTFGFNPLDWFIDGGDDSDGFDVNNLTAEAVLGMLVAGVSVGYSKRLKVADAFGKTHKVLKFKVNFKYHHPFVRFPRSAIKHDIKIRPQGASHLDIKAANAAFGKPPNYDWSVEYGEPHTWHHDVERGRMQLVSRSVHRQSLPHTGGVKIWYGD